MHNAQGALEYLLILGSAVLIGGIILALLTSSAVPTETSVKESIIDSLCSAFSSQEKCETGDPDGETSSCRPGDCVWENTKCAGSSERTETCFGGQEKGALCTEGQEQFCFLQKGVCEGAEETCFSGTWPGCDFETYEAWALSQGNVAETDETICDDEKDNDCDGRIDCGGKCISGSETDCLDGKDNDKDCFSDCVDIDCAPALGCESQECTDSDSDGYGLKGTNTINCSGSRTEYDCDDEDFLRNPGNSEICDNEIDDDCDGKPDCNDYDCIGNEACPVVECGVWTTRCCDEDEDNFGPVGTNIKPCSGIPEGHDCDDSNPFLNPAATEVCNDYIDNDCDLLEDCEDEDCSLNAFCETACNNHEKDNDETGIDCGGSCILGTETQCSNGIDDDKDCIFDCEDADCTGHSECLEIECVDSDSDGFGAYETNLQNCSGSPVYYDCDETNGNVFPFASENCANEIDDDCDGKIDCRDSDCAEFTACLCFNGIQDSGETRTDCGGSCAATCISTVSHPFYEITSPNILESEGMNWNADTEEGWIVTGVEYDAEISRTADGSGSFKLIPVEEGADARRAYTSERIPVEAGKVYSVSFYMMSDFPFDGTGLSYPALHPLVQFRNSDGSFSRNDSTHASVSRQGSWEEIVMFIYPKGDESFVRIHVIRTVPDSSNYPVPQFGNIWVDDFYLGEGIGFREPSYHPRDGFSGPKIRIDSLGNYELFEDGKWNPFFPFGIYADSSVPMQTYSDLGFNLNHWSGSRLDEAAEAVSEYNPKGMYSMLDISSYLYYSIPDTYKDFETIGSRIDSIQSSEYYGHFLGYYWDNESIDYEGPFEVINFIKSKDSGHPVYTLKGQMFQARALKNIVDVVGNCITPGVDSPSTGGWRLFSFDNIQETKLPMGIGIVTGCNDMKRREAEGLRVDFYTAIIKGARAVSYYRDPICNSGGKHIWETSLGSEVGVLRKEMEQLLPLIRENHWTGWSASSSSLDIVFGTRDNGKEGFIFAANPNESAITTSFAISGLDSVYIPSHAEDFFTDETVAEISGNSFTVTIPAYGTAVYRLVRPA